MTVLQMARISKVINDPNTIQGLLPHSFHYNSFTSYTSEIWGMLLNTIVEYNAPAKNAIQICNIKLLKLQIFSSLFSTICQFFRWLSVCAMDYDCQPGIQFSQFYFRKSCGLAKLQYSFKFTSLRKNNIYQLTDHKVM